MKTDMPVIAKFCGIVIRLLNHQTFGTHVHAFYGDCELVIGLNPLRVIQGEAPSWVRERALEWVGHHRHKLLSDRDIDLDLATPVSSQVTGHSGFVD